MVKTASSTGSRLKTPSDSSSLFPPEIKSTPNAVGSAAMSENIGTLGADIRDMRSWITRDIQDHEKCGTDTMLQELLYRCVDTSKPVPDKLILLKTWLNAILPICNKTGETKDIKQHLITFADCTVETSSYAHCARAANTALIELKPLDIPGLPSSKTDDLSDIVFHRNDPMYIRQYHQDAESKRKPDVVVVSCKSARSVRKGGKIPKKVKIYSEMACNAPVENFKWTDVLSTVEFKRTKNACTLPLHHTAEMKEMQERKQKATELLRSTAVPAASTSKTSNPPSRQSDQLKKRDSDHLGSTERSNNEQNDEDKEEQPTPVNALGSTSFRTFHAFFLLLIMQRMQHTQWGMNPLFGPAPGCSPTVVIEDEDKRQVDFTFNLESEVPTTHSGLRGRATNVFPVTSDMLSSLPRDPRSLNDTKGLAAKLYWPEEMRQSEPDILRGVYKIADGEQARISNGGRQQVVGHVPGMVWFHKFEETSTANIGRALGTDDTELGSRIFCIIVFRRLWASVIVTSAPSNLMFYETSSGVIIGVLNDYDLSSAGDTPTGNERTGTLPFMAMELLTKAALEGKVEHLYRHDAESFIWVLTWVCLRYEKDQLIEDRPLDHWLKVGAIRCREKKHDFLGDGRFNAQPTSSHQAESSR
ncbi:hypothetical protein K503DRAFT_785624 [Rhizopogon vinicolor AM-OR11-026]|uniref:Fungal-type protein kinase domain-containing protein n=1 Tax=Rhizopogon vinicolor AM-OR11-026 TaxID=1314800 RepID=A0A1B7MPV9_9AGAM|nr:hypothetical protein K503DRAFT_785624 [Rhizopogon vinicolor AM-OR11-026]